VIDSYKLHVFKDRLREQGFKFKVKPGPFPKALSILVDTDKTTEEMEPIIRKINEEAIII